MLKRIHSEALKLSLDIKHFNDQSKNQRKKIDKALLVSCTLDLGTNELANNLISAVSAQQAQRARNNSLSNSRAQSPIELEEKPEATSLPDDEVLNQSSSSVETEGNLDFDTVEFGLEYLSIPRNLSMFQKE